METVGVVFCRIWRLQNRGFLVYCDVMDNDEDILKDKNIMVDLGEPLGDPGADELAEEDDFSDEELAITADNVDAFADDSVRMYLRKSVRFLCLAKKRS